MSNINVLFTITDRSRLVDFISLYKEHGVEISYISLGHGTAGNDILSNIGLTKVEKSISFSICTDEIWKQIKKDLCNKLFIDAPGVGIAFVIPMSSIGGRREFNYLTDGLNYRKGKVSNMEGTKQELIVAICNQGYSEVVMDAARKAGAQGGSVIHARGTGVEKAERFLGISLASEKDVIYIVAKTTERNEILDSIMKDAGLDSDAKTIAFSLPVSDCAGIRSLKDED